jgi:predicted DNA binding CopG/RHH family protein
MSLQAAAVNREKKTRTIRLRVTESWFQWLEEAAASKGLDYSAYVRLALTERMKQDGVTPPPKRPRK